MEELKVSTEVGRGQGVVLPVSSLSYLTAFTAAVTFLVQVFC